MVFTVHRDLIGQNMYLRVTMHDPVTTKDSHLTLLHYTTQRLLSLLRINRDMIDENQMNETDEDKRHRIQLRAELGKMIVDHCFLQRTGDREGFGEELDHLQLPDDEVDSRPPSARSGNQSARALPPLVLSKVPQPSHLPNKEEPKTLLDIGEEHLLHKAEKVVHGRRVFIAFYGETTKADMINYSHNIRIVVADVQSLDVLAVQDFHEDTLEPLCARRVKRHLISWRFSISGRRSRASPLPG